MEEKLVGPPSPRRIMPLLLI